MESFELDARQVKAAMRFQAKADVRYYLNGIYLDKEGFIVATDGHRLIVIECDQCKDLKESIIIKIYGKLLVKSRNCKFSFIDENSGYITTKDKLDQETDQILKFKVIYGKFPDYKRVIPKGNPKQISSIGLNIEYLELCSDALKDLGLKVPSCEMVFYGRDKSVLMKVKAPKHKVKMVIMPVRL